MSVLLPLYIYPWPGVWDPLYNAASANPNVTFNVVINPCNGPCLGGIPEDTYKVEVPKLNSHPNVHTLGYVALNYSHKPIDTVLQEVQTWADWAVFNNNSGMAVDGIFFDEAPSNYDWQVYDFYMKNATDLVKGLSSLGRRTVVHNPGVVPNINWNYIALADITVVFEDTFIHWLDQTTFNALSGLPAATKFPKSKFAIMMHTIPSVNDHVLQWITSELKEMAGWSFVSSVGTTGEWWHSFSGLFNGFITHMAAG